jgi:hypothetical protein
MNRSVIEDLIQKESRKPASGTLVNLWPSYLPGVRTTLIEPVPETSDMAKLVAETRAKMKQEQAASVYVPSNFIASVNPTPIQFDPPDMLFDLPQRAIAVEAKGVSATVSDSSAAKPKPLVGTAKSTPPRVVVPERAPGARLHSLAKLLLTAEAYRRYVEPHLADVYLEYNQALLTGDVKAANRVVWRGYFEVVKPFAYGLLRSLFRYWLQTRR